MFQKSCVCTARPVGDNPTRLIKSLSQLKRKNGRRKENEIGRDDDVDDEHKEGEEKIWMTYIVEIKDTKIGQMSHYSKICV